MMNQKEQILLLLKKIWEKHPKLRFWQLLSFIQFKCNLPVDPFYVTDDNFLQQLKQSDLLSQSDFINIKD